MSMRTATMDEAPATSPANAGFTEEASAPSVMNEGKKEQSSMEEEAVPSTDAALKAEGVVSLPPNQDREQSSMAGSSSSSSSLMDTATSDDDLSVAKDPDEALTNALSLKEAGNTAFKAGDLTLAARSYRKALNLFKRIGNNTDDQVTSLKLSLQTNLCMVCWKQNKPDQCRRIATKALEADPHHVKALYWRAVALRKLGFFKEARSDLRLAFQQDSSNTSVKRELASLKKHMAQTTQLEKERMQKAFSGSLLYGDKEEEERLRALRLEQQKKEEAAVLERRKKEWEDECVNLMASGEEAISFEDWEKKKKKEQEEEDKKKKEQEELLKEEERKRRQLERAKRKAEKPNDDASSDDEELTEKELAMMRGYKKTADGKLTSYFTREVSSKEKHLIGDIAPKRLEASAEISPTSSATSAWNQAGTWEEKDTTDWCRSCLRSCLLASSSEMNSFRAMVTKVSSLEGHASVAMTGGRTRYIFDFHASLEYDLMDESDEVVASSKLKLPDISSTHVDDVEIISTAWTKSPPPASFDLANGCKRDLVEAVRVSVQSFVQQFNQQY